MIKNVNEGVCARRLQAGDPSFFVNWNEDGENNYRFFAMRADCFQFAEKLRAKIISYPLGLGRDPGGV